MLMKDIIKDVKDMLESYGLEYETKEIEDGKVIEYSFEIGDKGWTIMASNEAHFIMGGCDRGVMVVCRELGLYDKAYLHITNMIRRAIKDAKLRGVH